jgi:shikimate dehydrogenase
MGTAITGGTRILALIADPVVQARSPAMANAALARRGRLGDFVLVPMEVAASGLAKVVRGLRGVASFAGAVVSMPHKTAIVPLLDDLTAEARAVGAVNVVRRTPAGRLAGTILDGEGFVAGLGAAGHGVAGASCLMAGAGGAAAAIAFALVRHGCASLVIRNRTAAKAEALAARVRTAFPGARVRAGQGDDASYELAINATSLGMRPDDALPFPPDLIARTALVVECVVAPETTPLLEAARAAGRATHGGLPMLAAQIELMLDFMGVP